MKLLREIIGYWGEREEKFLCQEICESNLKRLKSMHIDNKVILLLILFLFHFFYHTDYINIGPFNQA